MTLARDGGDRDEHYRFPPRVLREYALLADGHRGAVCGPSGEIVWMCAPRWHDDAVFTALLGGAGVYAITPVEPFVWGGSYEPRSLIWRNRWVTASTVVECREALAYPGNPHRVVLLRRVEAVEREVRLRIVLDLRPGFGREGLSEVRRDEDGRWTARAGPLRMRWSGGIEWGPDQSGVFREEITVPAGGSRDLVLELSSSELGTPVEPGSAWRATANAWSCSVPHVENALAPRDAQQAYAVLRGLTRPGGGMVAAATMSLPERAEQGRNFDYRYAWIRDQCYAGIAVATHQFDHFVDETVSFMIERLLEDGDQLAPAYTTEGREIPDEQRLDLPGYPGGQTVVTGNHVTRQFQLDAFGELLQLLAVAGWHDALDRDGWRAVQVAVDTIARNWQRPEAGLWELDDQWWTHSRLSCVAGLRAAARVSRTAQDTNRMTSLADTIMAETSRRCLHPSGYWQRSPDHRGPDAALLLPAARGALPANDPRTRATVEAVRQRLCVDGYVYRFPQDPLPLGDAEGAFLLCGFIMALAHWHQGMPQRAVRWFERNRAACGPPGLFAEEYDVAQRQLRGNLPQAFVHAMLLECAGRMQPSCGRM